MWTTSHFQKSDVKPNPLMSRPGPGFIKLILSYDGGGVRFTFPSTTMVIQRRDFGFKSHPSDWKSPGSNLRPLVNKRSTYSI